MAELAAESPIVLDSWHLYDGTGVAVDRHRNRFTAQVREIFGVGEDESGAAYDHGLAHLPAEGSWFPAFVWTDSGLRLLARPFPVEHLRRTTTLLLKPLPDVRKRPGIKGFDYLWQVDGRQEALDDGYDDQVLAHADGSLSETVFATLAIVRDEELIVPDAPRLESVTLSVLREQAGLPVRAADVTSSDVLVAPAVITLSALHGVRMAEQVNDTAYQPNPELRQRLQATLETARRPMADLMPEGKSLPCTCC